MSGVWPQRDTSIDEMVEKAEGKVEELINRSWVWQGTQYDVENTALANNSETYTLIFGEKDKFRLLANCGTMKGKYFFSGRSLDIELNKNWFSRCRKDKILKVFLEELVRSQTAYLQSNALQISLAGSEGIMYFEDK